MKRLVMRSDFDIRVPAPRRDGETALLYPFDPKIAWVVACHHRTSSRLTWDWFSSEAIRLEPLFAELAPALLADIDAAEATPDDVGAQTRLASIEAIAAEVPVYAALLAARERYLGTLPWVAARHALRGWDGPGLPPFRRERGAIPADLLDTLPDAEIEAVGWKASALMQPNASAEGNSAAPSPSPETPAPTTEG